MSRTRRDDYYGFDNDRKKNWDKKKWYKPNRKAKNITKTQERAKTKDALRHVLDDEDERMPSFRKHNEWDWN